MELSSSSYSWDIRFLESAIFLILVLQKKVLNWQNFQDASPISLMDNGFELFSFRRL